MVSIIALGHLDFTVTVEFEHRNIVLVIWMVEEEEVFFFCCSLVFQSMMINNSLLVIFESPNSCSLRYWFIIIKIIHIHTPPLLVAIIHLIETVPSLQTNGQFFHYDSYRSISRPLVIQSINPTQTQSAHKSNHYEDRFYY